MVADSEANQKKLRTCSDNKETESLIKSEQRSIKQVILKTFRFEPHVPSFDYKRDDLLFVFEIKSVGNTVKKAVKDFDPMDR